jgi:D-beta-D-heptose 7-phosphate kinase/D-beta-D-heptose 1-phosphate adenosyltransferase
VTDANDALPELAHADSALISGPRDLGANGHKNVGFEDTRILVIGDLMLDVYVEGDVTRVSPEAPVAVLSKSKEHFVPGGAANVAANVASLGGRALLIGIVGVDANADKLMACMRESGRIDTSAVIRTPARPTTTKTRYMAARHQLLRVDDEMSGPLPQELMDALKAAIEHAMDFCDAVLISDYAKGACCAEVVRHAIASAQEKGVPSIVDPKLKDLTVYAGATVIKPNRAELAAAVGMPITSDAQCEAAGRTIVESTGSAVIVTRSEQGMSYIGPDLAPIHLPTFAKKVFEVSGAGDTVAAVLALGLGARLGVEYTMRCANHAAGVVVGKVGTATVSTSELFAALNLEASFPAAAQGQLATLEEACDLREIWRRMELNVGFTNGCFDLIHPGHVSLLKACAARCDKLIVGLNTDASVRRLKGPTRPIQDELSRAEVLGGLASVALVVLFDEDTPIKAITQLRPDVLFKGADYKEEQVVGADFVKSYGGRVGLIELVPGQSTSKLAAKIKAA